MKASLRQECLITEETLPCFPTNTEAFLSSSYATEVVMKATRRAIPTVLWLTAPLYVPFSILIVCIVAVQWC